MLSILIPVYNYDISSLLLSLKKQSFEGKIEIICCDDASTKVDKEKLSDLNKLSEVKIIKNNSNIGRTETRQKLAMLAKYKWLLFLDADVLPKAQNFISSYLKEIKVSDFDVCFGGFHYLDSKPSKELRLRWKYGRKKEMISAKERRLKPYKVLISANLLIKKEVFLKINESLKGNYYGYDNVFSILLKNNKSKINHIENPVIHYGLEIGETYLKKKEAAAKTVFTMYQKNIIDVGENDLLKVYLMLKKTKMKAVFSFLFSIIKPALKVNLLGSSPSILMLNIYRLGFFCNLK